MKAFTSIEQSKKLAEILPLESADMWFANGIVVARDSVGEPNDIKSVIPAWSLTSLLNVLPSATLDTSDDHYCRVRCKQRCTEWHDNPVDACYEMFLHLHEQKIL